VVAVNWTDLYLLARRHAEGYRCVVDNEVAALNASADPSLHALVDADGPTPLRLCIALDTHDVPVPREVEVQVRALCQPAPDAHLARRA
jgi:hypothetical protein